MLDELAGWWAQILVAYGAHFIATAAFIYFFAGVIKGTLGIGFPTAAVSLLAQFTDARTAIVVVIMPMLLTNVWQVFRSWQFLSVLREYWRMILSMSFFIFLFSQVSSAISVNYLAVVLGIIVVLFAVNSLYGRPLMLAERWNHSAQWAAGSSAGLMGGLVSVWAPPMLIYLGTRRLPKEQFVATVGTLLLVGSSFLLLSYWQSGVLLASLFILSSLLVIPSIIGFIVGEHIRHKLSAQRFERLLLWFFLLMGLNLIRKSLW